MENTFLPGTVRQRLADIMKIRKVSQTELAQRIGCQDSTISRFISGKTDKLSDENIIRIARVFNVSTDFILGVTTVPDRKNYEIDELGLSAQAARNLYTGKVNTQVVNRLLESPRFAELTYILEQYFDDTLAAGYAAQNQMYATLSSLTRKTVKSDAANPTAKKILQMRTPVYQADLTTIENQFMLAVREVKKEIGNDYANGTGIDRSSSGANVCGAYKGSGYGKSHGHTGASDRADYRQCCRYGWCRSGSIGQARSGVDRLYADHVRPSRSTGEGQ